MYKRQASLILAYGMRLALISTSESTFPVSHWVSEFAGSYLRSFIPLGLIFVVLFALAGFYSGGKLYKTARLPWITAVVAAGFGLFAGMAFMAENWFNLPRGVVPLGWVLTTLAVNGLRVASSAWTSVLKDEGRLLARKRPEDIQINSVLVIGGAGYIGSGLIPRLLNRGYNVRILDLLLWGTEPIKEVVDHPHLEIVKADLRQICLLYTSPSPRD